MNQHSEMGPAIANKSDSAHADPQYGTITPSTSTSNNSSQEHAVEPHQSFEASELHPRMEEKACRDQSFPAMQRTRTWERPAISTSQYTSAPKRMANGDVKTGAGSLPTSPTDPSLYVHSRNSSTTSRSSQIGEVGISTFEKTKTNLEIAFEPIANTPILRHGESTAWLARAQHQRA